MTGGGWTAATQAFHPVFIHPATTRRRLQSVAFLRRHHPCAARRSLPPSSLPVLLLRCCWSSAAAVPSWPPPYREARSDLDGDGTDDLLMLLDDPLWCDADGCPLLVFHGEADGSYTLVGRTDTTHAPIALGKHRNNGWHDLLVGVGGGTTQAGTVALQFDGEGYPVDPTMVALLANESAPVVQTLFE